MSNGSNEHRTYDSLCCTTPEAITYNAVGRESEIRKTGKLTGQSTRSPQGMRRSRSLPLVFLLTVSLLLPAVSPSWAKEPSSEQGAASIYSVVNLTTQKCDGPALIEWTVHPQRASIQHSGLLPLGDLGYRVNFKQIPDFREWTAAIRLHDGSRTVDDSYVLFTRLGYGPFDAAYVITRLPEGIPDAEHAFQVVMQMQRTSAGSGKVSFIRADTPFGQGLEMVAGARVGSTCFPTSKFQYAETAQAPSIGISRFVVKDRDLIEYALVLPWPQGMSQADAIERAQVRMNAFQRGLEATGHDGPKNAKPQ